MTQYILFKAGDQTFGLPISETDKIIALENHTPVPDMSSYIVGVQEVEGEVIAVIDLSDRFYQKPHLSPEEADIILVNWKDTTIGLLVDEVTVVKTFNTEDLLETEEEKIDGLSTSYISFFVQTEEGIIPILDSHYLFAEEKGDELRRLVSIHAVKD